MTAPVTPLPWFPAAEAPGGTRSPAPGGAVDRLVLDPAAVALAGPRGQVQDAGLAAPTLLVVADGVGGGNGGAQAARLAVTEVARRAAAARETGEDGAPDAGLAAAVAAADAAIRSAASADPALAGMATTCTAAVLTRDGRVVVAHVGDSRAHLLRGGVLTRLTTDHTLVQTLVASGELTPEQAAASPMRSVLLRALGGSADPGPADLLAVRAEPGDRLLLCSDGLSGVVPAATLQRVLTAERRPAAAASRLVLAALAAGTRDDVTVVVGDVAPAGWAGGTAAVAVGAAGG
ncbi:serine/threonine protein phosphatase PrpC [Geodermatophilus tzadiensis]|uniref:Serine/threonine protein phosphatase PrpC n=1 Tax=Geodermatophilus tzadiensis TaxID=1137988 RepID=A0A2T0TP52_9ACTN|nr:protein phosphatase 2C domain-containing protein [Geodermatophilus tzadiensis]PRY47502.1 serine/threonine protein phosphatase PrpC [Geodermatophilus tzadiensis]